MGHPGCVLNRVLPALTAPSPPSAGGCAAGAAALGADRAVGARGRRGVSALHAAVRGDVNELERLSREVAADRPVAARMANSKSSRRSSIVETMTDAAESLAPGTLVQVIPKRGAEGEQGILVRAEPKPGRSWLRAQLDARWRQHRDARWWSVMPLDGGLNLVPAPLLRSVRRASYADVMQAVEYANEAGRRTLAGLFPDLVAKLVEERGGKP